MSNTPPRALNRVSRDELSRRWQATRTQMRARGIEALVVQNSSDWVGGYIRWFSNQPATNGYPCSLMFPLEGGMSFIEQGPFGGLRIADKTESDTTGIERRLTTPSYPSVAYTGSYDAEIIAAEIRRVGARRVGLVAPASMYHSFGQHLGELLVDTDIVDATDTIDRIKAIKSPEERALIRQVAAMQDETMRRVASYIKPGLKDFEVAAYAQYVGQQLGSEQGIFIGSSAPTGQAASFRPRSMQGRTMEHGDVYSLLVENNGAGGYYTELSRIFVLGRAPQDLQDAYAAVLDAQRFGLSLLVPGTRCSDVFAQHNAYLNQRAIPQERRLSMHGMGYDMVERPLIRQDEVMQIEENMSIVCHPGILNDRMFVHNTDNYFVEARGVSDCLHQTPKMIFEVPVATK
jgi:Xaa-Pro aminopeptidase